MVRNVVVLFHALQLMSVLAQHPLEPLQEEKPTLMPAKETPTLNIIEVVSQVSRRYDKLFKEMNVITKDDVVDKNELKAAGKNGILSQADLKQAKLYDLNGDGALTLKEMLFSPLVHHMMSNHHPKELDAFLQQQGAESDTIKGVKAAVTKLMATSRRRVGQLMRNPKSPPPLLLVSASADEKNASQLAVAGAGGGERDNDLIELDTHKMGGFLGGLLGGGGGKKDAGAKGTPYPQAKYGIPSVNDDKCVLCEFFMEQAAYRVYSYVMKSRFDTADVSGAGPYEVKHTIEDVLQDKAGGMGIARVLVEDEYMDFCSPINMPDLFQKICDKLYPHISELGKSLYFGLSPSITCNSKPIQICGMSTYWNKKGSIHTPIKSNEYNGGRGKCGFAGGNHAFGGGGLGCAVGGLVSGLLAG